MTAQMETDRKSIVQERHEAGDSIIIIAPISGHDADSPYLTDDDRRYLTRFGNPKRRDEQAAWRAIVRREAGAAPIRYTPNGRPFLKGTDINIGVSHTAKEAAVIFSHGRCAIDLEFTNRNFAEVASRYVSPAEFALSCSGEEWFLPAIWCAKETLYKFADYPRLSLLDDMRITAIYPEMSVLEGAIRQPDGKWLTLPMHMIIRHGSMCVWTTERQ